MARTLRKIDKIVIKNTRGAATADVQEMKPTNEEEVSQAVKLLKLRKHTRND